MIAVLDTTRDGWRFVRILSGLGQKVSWIVPKAKSICFEALPASFRGCVHKIGFEDASMISSAFTGCDTRLILTDTESPEELVAQLVETNSESSDAPPMFVVDASNGTFEFCEVTRPDETSEPASTRDRTQLLPLHHVG